MKKSNSQQRKYPFNSTLRTSFDNDTSTNNNLSSTTIVSKSEFAENETDIDDILNHDKDYLSLLEESSTFFSITFIFCY
jgi:hypothetical protein